MRTSKDASTGAVTLIQRFGSAWLSGDLRAAGFSLRGIAFTAVPLALLWAAASIWMGRKHQRKLAILEAQNG